MARPPQESVAVVADISIHGRHISQHHRHSGCNMRCKTLKSLNINGELLPGGLLDRSLCWRTENQMSTWNKCCFNQ